MEQSKLFNYFLTRLDHWQREQIKTEEDLIKFYDDNIVIRDIVLDGLKHQRCEDDNCLDD